MELSKVTGVYAQIEGDKVGLTAWCNLTPEERVHVIRFASPDIDASFSNLSEEVARLKEELSTMQKIRKLQGIGIGAFIEDNEDLKNKNNQQRKTISVYALQNEKLTKENRQLTELLKHVIEHIDSPDYDGGIALKLYQEIKSLLESK